jgi:hypothetical protein
VLATLAIAALSAAIAIPPPLNASRADRATQALAGVCMNHTGFQRLDEAGVRVIASLDVVGRDEAPAWLVPYVARGARPSAVLEYPTRDDESDAFALAYADGRCTIVVRGVDPAIPEAAARLMMRYWRARSVRTTRRGGQGITYARFSMNRMNWDLEARDLPGTAERGVLVLTSSRRGG